MNPKAVLAHLELQILVTVSDLQTSLLSREIVLESMNAQAFTESDYIHESMTPTTETGDVLTEQLTRNLEEQVVLSFLYHKSPYGHPDKIIHEDGCILFPFTIPIDIPKKRSKDTVTISCNFSFSKNKHSNDNQEADYSIEDVESVYRLCRLESDSKEETPFTRHERRDNVNLSRIAKHILPLQMPLKLCLESVKQDGNYLFSLELESKLKNQVFEIQDILLEATDFVVNSFAQKLVFFTCSLFSCVF